MTTYTAAPSLFRRAASRTSSLRCAAAKYPESVRLRPLEKMARNSITSSCLNKYVNAAVIAVAEGIGNGSSAGEGARATPAKLMAEEETANVIFYTALSFAAARRTTTRGSIFGYASRNNLHTRAG